MPIASFMLAAASAGSFAIFPPSRGCPPADAQIVSAARANLARPPVPLPRLHTEGTLPGQGIRDISIAARRDLPIALDLALAWRMTGDRAYLAAASGYLGAWARTYRTDLNPIDDTGFDLLAMAYDLVEGDLTPAEREPVDRFWRSMAVGYLDAMDGTPKHATTNWQSHRIKLATLAAFQSGDADLIARAHAAFKRQIAVNLRADGSTFDFEERDALHYVTYNLDPLLTAALAARMHGRDWFGEQAPSGASLSRSLDWLARYARGERRHVEFARSRIAFDRERAAAGQQQFAPHPWDPGKAADTYTLAAMFRPGDASLRDRLAARTGRRPPAWMRLLSDAACKGDDVVQARSTAIPNSVQPYRKRWRL